MNGYYTYKLFDNHDFLQALDDFAGAFSRKKSIKADLLATAWIAIAESEQNYTNEYYTKLGYAVMRRKYELYHMEVPKKFTSWDKGIRRSKKKIKKFYIKRSKNTSKL